MTWILGSSPRRTKKKGGNNREEKRAGGIMQDDLDPGVEPQDDEGGFKFVFFEVFPTNKKAG